MQIKLKLMGMLRDKLPEGSVLELDDSATIGDALAALDIDADRVQVFTVNGSLERDKQRTLSDGDELSVIPPVGGG